MKLLTSYFNLLHKCFNRRMFTGYCVCGHSVYSHHGNIIMRRKCYSPRDMYGMLYGECEIGEINGEPTGEEVCPCNFYTDRGWIFIRLSRFVSGIKCKLLYSIISREV